MNKPTSALRKLVLGSGMRFFALLVSVAIGFMMTPFYIRTLGDRQFGLWMLATSFVGMFSLMDMGLNSAVSRQVASALGKKDYDGLNRYLNTGFFLFTGIGIASMLLAGCIIAGMFFFYPEMEDVDTLSVIGLILGLQFAINLPINAIGGLLTGSLRYDITTLISVTFKIARVLVIFPLLYFGGRLIAMALASLVLSIVERFIVHLYARREVPQAIISTRLVSRDAVKELFSYSTFTFITQIADKLRFQIPSFVIAGFVSVGAVSHYSIAITLINYFMDTIYSFIGVLVPVFARQSGLEDELAIKKTLYFSLKVSTVITSFIAFGFIGWGRPFIECWMGTGYLDAYPCLVLLTIGFMTDLWQTPCVGLLYGTAKHHFYSITNSAEAAIIFLLSLFLVKKFGMVGVAIGTMLPMVVIRILVQPRFVCKVIKDDISTYYTNMLKIIGVCAFGLLMPAGLAWMWAEPSLIRLLLLGTISFILYLPIVVFWGFTLKERTIIWNAVKSKNKSHT